MLTSQHNECTNTYEEEIQCLQNANGVILQTMSYLVVSHYWLCHLQNQYHLTVTESEETNHGQWVQTDMAGCTIIMHVFTSLPLVKYNRLYLGNKKVC